MRGVPPGVSQRWYSVGVSRGWGSLVPTGQCLETTLVVPSGKRDVSGIQWQRLGHPAEYIRAFTTKVPSQSANEVGKTLCVMYGPTQSAEGAALDCGRRKVFY